MAYLAGWWKWAVSWFAAPSPVEPSGEALLEAARGGDARAVRAQLAAGVPPDETRTRDFETALLLATRFGHAEVARALVEAGADPGADDGTGDTPLINAAAGGHHGIITLIAASWPEVFRTEAAAMALRHAALHSHPESVAALLASGTPPNARPRGLPPALFAAISDGACVLELLEAGADPHAVDDEGQTPLHYAAAANEHTAIRILLTYDANLDARDNAGRTPIDLAPTDFVRRLLRPMPDPARPLPNGSVVRANNGD